MGTKNLQDALITYGATLVPVGTKKRLTSADNDLYYYEVFIGGHEVKVENGDCAYFLSKSKSEASVVRGPVTIKSYHIATIVRGYRPENKTSELSLSTYLPYINGCSTKQIFPPERPGDPTLQMLHIPPYAHEQFHHIHSTVRVVYILDGVGKSVVGLQSNTKSIALNKGDIVILNKMCPHHFETQENSITVLPLHIFSTTGDFEFNHPMFLGTHKI